LSLSVSVGVEVDTPHGVARVRIDQVDGAVGALLLGHGAGGGVGARDLGAAAAGARSVGFSVALVEQPYRVAGRRSPAPAAQLDAAWLAIVSWLTAASGPFAGLPLVCGGRSAGARVACRTAAECGAVGVLCLAFPLHPPGRADRSRLGELDDVAVPVLVVQGASDPFGMPPGGDRRKVVVVKGNHSLTGDLAGVREAVEEWLGRSLRGALG
jgi:uncharacterized protein